MNAKNGCALISVAAWILYFIHQSQVTPVLPVVRVWCQIGNQIIYEGITTNQMALWHTTSNGPWCQTFHGIYSVGLYPGVTTTWTQRYW